MSGEDAYFFGAGPCSHVARSVDWERTPLGPIERWPNSLRTTLAILFHSRHPMFLWWGRDLIQFYNDAYVPSFGVGKHPRAMGQPGRECWPEIWPMIGPQIEDVMRRAVPSWNEDQLVPIFRNGVIEDVYWTYGYSPVFDESGSVAGTLVVCTETTARVLAERRLSVLRALSDALLAVRDPADVQRLAEPPLRTAASDVPFAIVAIGDGTSLLIGLDSSAAAEILQQLEGPRTVSEVVPLRAPVVMSGLADAVRSVFAVPVGGQGQVIFGLSSRLPFCARYELFLTQLARQLEETQARARVESERRNLLERAPVPAALIVGPDYVFEVANEPYCQMVGRDVRGRAYFEAFPELRDSALTDILSNVYRSGQPFVTNELRVPLARGKDGALEERFFKFNLAPIKRDDGRVRTMMAIAVEVTEQVVARKELQAAARAKDEFLATMSHELRTPLNAMLGWTKILKDNLHDSAKLQQGIAVIERNAHAQERIVSDVLDVSRIISGKLRLSLSPVDITATISAAADGVRPAADAKGVALEVDLAPKLGVTLADPERIQQILWNLLSNAIRLTAADGKVRLSVSRSGSRLCITITDTGAGIRAEDLARIFERFRQLDGSQAHQHGGLGLGLAIVRYLTEAHGGSVSAHSRGVGQGATFEVLLPIRSLDSLTDTELDSRVGNPAPVPVPVPPTRLNGTRVLAVDDHEDSLDLLCELLTDAGAVVTSAQSAAEALAEPGPFDIVVSDIGMPIADGYDLIRAIRARDVGGDVPAIAVTAFARAADISRARSAGFQAHIAKPYDPDQLLATIRRFAGAQR